MATHIRQTATTVVAELDKRRGRVRGGGQFRVVFVMRGRDVRIRSLASQKKPKGFYTEAKNSRTKGGRETSVRERKASVGWRHLRKGKKCLNGETPARQSEV